MVLIHIANIDTSVIGGVQTAVPQMIRAQSQFATVGFINIHGEEIDGVRMLELGESLDFSSLPAPFDRPDLVIFHEVYRYKYTKICKILNKNHIPYIVLPHGCLSREAQKRKFLKKFVANALFFKRFLKSAAAIQYLSENEAGLSAFKKYPSFISGNGIRVPNVRKSEFFRSGVRFVYIGRLEIVTKGLDLLIEAVKKCAAAMRAQGASLEIYGPDYGGEHAVLRQMAKRCGVCDLVTVGDRKIGIEKEEILLASDCFIQASRTEGLPMGPLEALGYGLPCIITHGATLAEIVNSYGAGIPAETSSDGIARAILEFLDSKKNIEVMSGAAVRLIEEQYHVDRVAERAVQIYGGFSAK